MPYSNPTGFPSVTQSLKFHIDTQFFTDEARDRGSAVHGAAAAHLLGLFIAPLPDAWQGYFDSFRRWADLMVDRVVVVEQRLVDPELGIAGKPDLVAVLRADDCNALVDWKTGAPSKWWPLQIAAYRKLLKVGCFTNADGKPVEFAGIDTTRGGCVRLYASGRAGKFYEYTDTFQRDLNIFYSVLNAYKYFEK